MAHGVEIDEESIHAERASLQGEFIGAGESAAGHDEAGPSKGYQSWAMLINFLGPQAHGLICPNWRIDPDGGQIMREGFIEQLVAWFPNGIPGFDRMELDSPWLKIVGGAVMIALANADLQTMTLRPMRQPPEPDGEADDARAAA